MGPSLLGLALVALGWTLLFPSWLRRTTAAPDSTPALPALASRAEVRLEPGHTACLSPVRFDADAGRLRLVTQAGLGAGPLLIRAGTRGWTVVRTIPVPAAGVDAAVDVPLPTYPGRPADGRVCATNTGPRPVVLVGTNEPRSTTITTTTVDGQPAPGNARATLLVLERGDRAPKDSTGVVARHLSAMSGGSAPAWTVWVLGILLVLGVPLAAFAALALARRED